MNAKKIMGAVLVALLAAALFVGAGAAALPSAVFTYQENTDSLPEGTWTNGKSTVTIGEYIIPGNDFAAGIHQITVGTTTYKVYVSNPTATIIGSAGSGESAYIFTGATYYGGVAVDVTQSNPADLTPAAYLLTFPNVTTIAYTYNDNPTDLEAVIKNLEKGTYKLALKFNIDNFMTGTNAGLLVTEPVSFTVAGAEDATISASVDQMIKGEEFVVTVAGKPGITYAVNATKFAFNITEKQPGITIDDGNATIVMPNTGKVSFTMAGNTTVAEKEQTLKLQWLNDGEWNNTKAKVTVKFMKGTVSAKADAASYFVGDVVTITGSTTAGKITTIDIKGTNFEVKNLQNSALDEDIEYEGDVTKTFTVKLNTSLIVDINKKLDVGTYTITLNTTSGVTAVVPVALKQPFISIVEAPEVVVKKTDAEFIINAEATEMIAYYIFGTNYFDYKVVDTNVEDEDGEDIENQFLVELDKEVTAKMDAGQYFAVFQHPMYDGMLNIVAEDNIVGLIDPYLATPQILFDVDLRQTANAAQALCDALDSQNIDDMYVKYSFFVVGEGESFEISELPTTVVKGDKIVITGVDTANKGEYVTAEMISTAFAAVPKETVGSAAFIVVTAQINEDDGTFELTLDTSDLNVDEYSLSVAINSVTQKTTTINVVEAGDEPVNPEQPEEPEQPEQPEEPVAPATPGFGALAALAGLGAVAVLLLRRE